MWNRRKLREQEARREAVQRSQGWREEEDAKRTVAREGIDRQCLDNGRTWGEYLSACDNDWARALRGWKKALEEERDHDRIYARLAYEAGFEHEYLRSGLSWHDVLARFNGSHRLAYDYWETARRRERAQNPAWYQADNYHRPQYEPHLHGGQHRGFDQLWDESLKEAMREHHRNNP